MQESKLELTKVVSLVKNIPNISSPLKDVDLHIFN